mmetsp:Transcript_6945/g.10160  ORF Transcript_6945/g.10160 Transcript_6945/m.10160 type:complete len:967 (-) Transcript_6945:39-2939(-)
MEVDSRKQVKFQIKIGQGKYLPIADPPKEGEDPSTEKVFIKITVEPDQNEMEKVLAIIEEEKKNEPEDTGKGKGKNAKKGAEEETPDERLPKQESFCSKEITEARVIVSLVSEFTRDISPVLLNQLLSNKHGKIASVSIYRAESNENLGNPFGSAEIDFASLLENKTHKVTIKVPMKRPEPVEDPKAKKSKGKPKKGAEPEEPLEPLQDAELDIEISVEGESSEGHPLFETLPPVYFSLKAGTLSNLPERWIPKGEEGVENNVFEYGLRFSLPLGGEATREYNLVGGRMFNSEDESFIIGWEQSNLSVVLSKEARKQLEQWAIGKKNIDVTFYRTVRSEMNPDNVEDENELKYRATIEFPVENMLKPGTEELTESFQLTPVPAPPAEPEDPKAKKKDAKKGKGGGEIAALLAKEEDEEEHPYITSNTTISLSLSISKPLIPLAKDRERPDVKPSDIIPKREPIIREKPVREKLREEFKEIALQLANEYVKFNESEEDTDAETKEEFIFHLNNSGFYYTFKETLKKTVIDLVKKYYAVPNLENKQFFNQLYVDLVTELNKAISDLSSTNQQNSLEEQLEETKDERLVRLAREHEFNNRIQEASQIYEQRITSDPNSATFWYDYGAFNIKFGDFGKAEHALRQALGLSMSHMPSLLLYGVLLLVKEQYKEAEVILQNIIDIEEENTLGWSFLYVFFVVTENEEQANQAFIRAQQSCSQPTSIRLLLADYLLQFNIHTITERILLDELEETKEDDVLLELYNNLGRMYIIREDFARAEENLSSAIEKVYKNPKAWKLMGDMHYLQPNHLEEARKAYETAVSVGGTENNDYELYLRLGDVYLQDNEFEQAKNSFIDACQIWPCASSWLGVGQSYYRLAEYVDAEQALNESNILNNDSPTVWFYLCLNAIQLGKKDQAERTFREGIRSYHRHPTAYKIETQTLVDEVYALAQSDDVFKGLAEFIQSMDAIQ